MCIRDRSKTGAGEVSSGWGASLVKKSAAAVTTGSATVSYTHLLQAKEAMKQDMTLPLQLYTQITPYMVTDVTADEAVYLAGQADVYKRQELYKPENLLYNKG